MGTEISRVALKACAMFASTDATRYNLNGIHLEDGGRLIATDGHRLLTVAPLGDYGDVNPYGVEGKPWDTFGTRPLESARLTILELGDVKAALKAFGARGPELLEFAPVDPVTLTSGPNLGTLSAAGTTASVELIDGEFPDWRNVAKVDETREPDAPLRGTAGFNPKYLRDMAEAFRVLGCKAVVQRIGDGLAPAMFWGTTDTLEAVGVVMPMRCK